MARGRLAPPPAQLARIVLEARPRACGRLQAVVTSMAAFPTLAGSSPKRRPAVGISSMPAELTSNTILSGTYRVVRTIGRGGMGEVYEVQHIRTGAPLALKILLNEGEIPRELLQRFRREAEITSKLNHPNIVRVMDFDTTRDGRPFLVMELLQGRELTALLAARRPLPLSEVSTIVDQVSDGLSAAHERGVVHRDLKPANVFLTKIPGGDRELVKLLDFGISKVRSADNITRTDAIIGTPHYMSPEQAMGRTATVDGRADQFALAVMAYEMLSGRMAFAGDTPVAVLYQVVHEDPPPLTRIVPGLPPAVETVLNRGMAKRPDERFVTVGAFAEAFQRAVRDGVAISEVQLPRTLQLPSSVGPDQAPPLGFGMTAQLPHDTTLQASTGQLQGDDAALASPSQERRRLVVATVGVVATALVVIIALARWSGNESPSASRAQAAPDPSPSAAPPVSPPYVVTPLIQREVDRQPAADPSLPESVAPAEKAAVDPESAPKRKRVRGPTRIAIVREPAPSSAALASPKSESAAPPQPAATTSPIGPAAPFAASASPTPVAPVSSVAPTAPAAASKPKRLIDLADERK